MLRFSVTYAIGTTESVEAGDTAEQGFLLENGTLREAVGELLDLPALDYIEADSCPVTREHAPRWFSGHQGSDRYLYLEEGQEFEERALHLPESMTPSSRMRLARLLGCYGVRARGEE